MTVSPIDPKLCAAVRNICEAFDAHLESKAPPPATVYHYCDANTLLNIFKTGKLWATSTKYLNDKTELVSLFSNVESHLGELPEDPCTKVLIEKSRITTGLGGRILSSAIGLETFVTCFSEDGDLLSQWRAYGDNGLGFAIGFDTATLTSAQAGAGAFRSFHRMLYGGEPERALISDLFVQFHRAVSPHVDELETTGWTHDDGSITTTATWISLRLGERLANLTFECKHRAFAEEREWRMIASSGPEILFRTSQGRIVPYVELDLAALTAHGRLPVSEIVLGPRLDRLDTERVLTYLADRYGYGHSGISFRASDAPYR